MLIRDVLPGTMIRRTTGEVVFVLSVVSDDGGNNRQRCCWFYQGHRRMLQGTLTVMNWSAASTGQETA